MTKNAENLINNRLKFSLQQSYHYEKVNLKSIIIWRRNKKLIITHRQSQHIKCRYRLYMSWDIQPPGIPPIWFALLKFAMKSTHPTVWIHLHSAQVSQRDWAETVLMLKMCWVQRRRVASTGCGSGVLLASAQTHAHARAPIQTDGITKSLVLPRKYEFLFLFTGQQWVQLFRTRLCKWLN